jgi:outer membrane protein assembly factor BamA
VSFTSTMAASVMLVAVSAAGCHHERGLKSPATGEPIVVAEPTLQGAKAGTRAVFGDIEIVGNTTLADQVIRRQLLYRPGDLFSRKDILDSQRRLASMPLLDSVNIETIDDPRRADVRTRVTVVEGDPRRVSFAFGFGTEEKLAIEATLEHVNFFGGARTLGIDGKWSWLDRGVEGRFLQPYFFRRDLSLTLHGRAWHVDERRFRALSQGGRATVTHTPAPALSTSVSLVHEFDTSRIIDESLRDLSLRNELNGIGLDSTTGTQKGVLSAVAIEVRHSTVTDSVDPHEGHVLLVQAERAGGWLAGTFDYYNVLGEGRYYTTTRRGLTFAQRIRYGSIGSREGPSAVPYFRRYFLGGSNSLRGWGRYEVSPLSGSGLPIGGASLFEAGTEVRFPIASALSGAVFVDTGAVWRHAGTFRVADLLYDSGTGLRYLTPIGPVRVDIAYQLTALEGLRIEGRQQRRWRIHFSIGQAF